MSSNNMEMLLSQLTDAGAKTKLAAKFGGYVRDRLREVSFFEKIIPSENITASDCQVSERHEGLVKMEWLEPRARAMVASFRGEPQANLIRGERVAIPFFTIMSDMFQKPEQEFLGYPYPIGKVVEDNAVKDIQEIQDREGLIHVDAAVQALQAEANGGVTALNATAVQGGSVVEFSVAKGDLARAALTDDGYVHPIQRPDIVRLIKMLDTNRLESDLLLLSAPDYDDILSWTVTDQGDKIQSETAVEGWKYNTLLGKRFVRTIKTDILRPGNVYCFTSPDFLGRFYVLNNTKFYIDKVVNLVKFVAWKDIALGLVNVAACRKLELYSGDATSTDTDSILSAVTPMAEEDLGKPNNRVAQGIYFPGVVTF